MGRKDYCSTDEDRLSRREGVEPRPAPARMEDVPARAKDGSRFTRADRNSDPHHGSMVLNKQIKVVHQSVLEAFMVVTCEDGTMWRLFYGEDCWERLPDIPTGI